MDTSVWVEHTHKDKCWGSVSMTIAIVLHHHHNNNGSEIAIYSHF